MRNQRADVQWRDGQVPVSIQFDDPYFSLDDGLAETNYVFLDGNGLPQRFRDGFHIAELGFGTGLNFLATAQCWINSGCSGKLHYTSFEAFPLARDDMAQALTAFPELADLAQTLISGWRSDGGLRGFENGITLELVVGDARATLPEWQGRVDAWFLDGFAPARNPELWEPSLLAEVARRTAPGGTAATYTAAGAVRRGLESAGFHVTRFPGFGRKRHMTRAHLK